MLYVVEHTVITGPDRFSNERLGVYVPGAYTDFGEGDHTPFYIQVRSASFWLGADGENV